VKGLVASFAIGIAITSIPVVVGFSPISSDSSIVTIVNILLLPGFLVALVMSGWRAHAVHPYVMGAANVVCYSVAVYSLLRRRDGGLDVGNSDDSCYSE
jgi:hypothetical protein